MDFSIILTVEVPASYSVKEFWPRPRRAWEMTECYTDDEFGVKEKHRKWRAILDRKQFDRFVEQFDLVADDTETMGSIGAPGFGVGAAPAISFNGGKERVYVNAYVTPVPVCKVKGLIPKRRVAWERVRRAVLNVYGRGPKRYAVGGGHAVAQAAG